MLARRIPTILPEMTPEEQMETSIIYSVTGALSDEHPIIRARPFRQLSERATEASILGGGPEPMPGEVSKAHNGVLFIDEFLEYSRDKIECLRRPMEEKKVTLIRKGVKYVFPADFLLVGATNPCKCGYLGDKEIMCTCTQSEIDKYRSRLSGPMTDRIDICIELPRIDYEGLKKEDTQSSEEMRETVARAFDIQKERFRDEGIFCNAGMTNRMIDKYCRLDKECQQLLEKIIEHMGLSARACSRILKLARTIADLEGVENITSAHLTEAASYRFLDKQQLL
jgi:magnesium chelatase family protein